MPESQKMHTEVFKNGQPESPGSVLLGVLKSIETELRRRDLLGVSCTHATPLWFLAETERNIFLWRRGKSIDDHRQFSFWVDIRRLLAKRRQQLFRCHGFNPFIHSSLQSTPNDTDVIDHESAYLDCVEELSSSIFRHAEALSHASETLRQELAPSSLQRISIILPAHPHSHT